MCSFKDYEASNLIFKEKRASSIALLDVNIRVPNSNQEDIPWDTFQPGNDDGSYDAGSVLRN